MVGAYSVLLSASDSIQGRYSGGGGGAAETGQAPSLRDSSAGYAGLFAVFFFERACHVVAQLAVIGVDGRAQSGFGGDALG